jgi:hypothetical protein
MLLPTPTNSGDSHPLSKIEVIHITGYLQRLYSGLNYLE